MGFGSMMKSAMSAETTSTGGNRMPNVFLDVKEGKRTFRFIPDLNNPGEPMQGKIVMSVWMPVKRDGVMMERRVFIDDAGRRTLPDTVREKIKNRFFLNVYDRTRVVKLPDGSLVYPTPKNEFWKKEGDRNTQITDIRPEPNNAIMVLEGSVSFRTDRRGGLLNDIDDLSKTLFDDEGTKLIPITEVDIEMVTRGTGMATTRTVHPGMNREPFPKSALELPVYDLDTFTKPWPVAALKALLDGADYSEVMKTHNLVVVPQLMGAPGRPATASNDSIFD